VSSRNVQLAAGVLFVLIFAGTGAYMHFAHDHLRGMEPAKRMVYRASHINILLIGAANIACSGRTGRKRLETIARVLLIGAGAFFLIAFALEPSYANLHRPWTRIGVYMTAASAVLLVFRQR
jgi:cell division protein FtsW (lipid II flippase)